MGVFLVVPARMRPVVLNVPNATNDNGKSGINRTAQEPDISRQLTNGNVPHLSRPAAREHQKAFGRSSKGMQTNSSNSASSSVSIQGCEIYDDAIIFIDMREETLPDSNNVLHNVGAEAHG
ncbi:hypothetical protein AAHE18_04G223600 [Arachis hypogaea]